jgi:hypothetical protein
MHTPNRKGRYLAARSVYFNHMLTAVLGISNQPLAARIDNEIKHLKRNLADQRRHTVRHFNDIDRALSPLDREPNGVVDRGHRGASTGRYPFLGLLDKSKLCDHAGGQRKGSGARIDKRLGKIDTPNIRVRELPSPDIPQIAKVLDGRSNKDSAHLLFLHAAPRLICGLVCHAQYHYIVDAVAELALLPGMP